MDHTGVIQTTRRIMFREGPHAFYKGIGGPLASVPILNAIVFTSYETSRKLFEKQGKTGYFYSIFLSF